VRVVALLKQGSALKYAEAMLFIDDTKSKTPEFDGILNYGMRPDQKLEPSVSDLGQQLFSGGSRSGSCQKPDLDAEGLQKG